MADFDGDFWKDLAIANAATNNVTILRNNHAGFTPFPASPIAVGTHPVAIVATDLNDDGFQDLVVLNNGSNNVTILLGDNTGHFTQPVGSPFAAGTSPVAVYVADVNHDSNPDLIIADADGHVTVLEGNFIGQFTPFSGSPFAAGSSPSGVTVADFNGDGVPDIAVSNSSTNTVTVLLGDGSGNFSPAPHSPFATGVQPVALVSFDFNGDGIFDLATANQGDNTVTVLLGDFSGIMTPAPGSPLAAGTGPTAIATADLNSDGQFDLAIANSNGKLTLLLGPGNGTFVQATQSPFTVGTGPVSLIPGNVRGLDFPADLTVLNNGSNNLTVFIATPLASFPPTIAPPLGSSTVADDGPEHGNAITAGTGGDIWLWVYGIFDTADSFTASWTDTLTHVTTDISPGIMGVGPDLIVIQVSGALWANPVAVVDPINIVLTDTTLSASTSAPYFINPALSSPQLCYQGATVGVPYSHNLFIGGTPPLNVSEASGSGPEPPGFFPPTEPYAGTPTAAGLYEFRLQVIDAWGNFFITGQYEFQVATTPSIGILPATVPAGSPDTVLNLSGSGFLAPTTAAACSLAGSQAYWGPFPAGVPLATTVNSDTSATVTVPTAFLQTPGSVQVQLQQPGAGGVGSNLVTFMIVGPALSNLSPSSVIAGAPDFTLTVNGSNFLPGSQILFNGSPLTTNFVNSGQLTATITSAQVSTAGTFSVIVTNPGGSTTTVLNFTVTASSIASLVPSTTVAGSADFTLTVNGSGPTFTSGSQIMFGGTPLTTTFVSTSQLKATVQAALVAFPALIPVTVVTGALISPPSTFTVTPNPNPTPTITPPLQSSLLAAGGPTNGNAITSQTPISGFLLYINGHFNAGFTHTVTWLNTSTSASSNFTTSTGIQGVSPTQIVVSIPAALFSAAVSSQTTVNVTVTETQSIPSPPPPVVSNAAPFLINPPLASTSTLYPGATVGVPYLQNLAYTGGTAPFAATLASGTVPPGINLSPTAGPFAGTPTTPGNFTFSIKIADAWGNTTTPAGGLQVVAAPSIAPPLSPASAQEDAPGFQLTITGANFVQPQTIGTFSFLGSVAQWTSPGSSQVALTTVVASATQITATVPASLLTVPGTAQVVVIQPNGLAGNIVGFLVIGPTITSLTPSSMVAGSAGFTLAVAGSNFVSGAQVSFGGATLVTTFINAGSLTAQVPASAVAVPGPVAVTVVNPGNIVSNPAAFQVSVNPVTTPAITVPLQSSPPTALGPTLGNAITSGTNLPSFLLYITGNFDAGDNHTVNWQNTATHVTTTFTAATGIQSVSPTQIIVSVPAALFSSLVTSQVTVNVTVTEQEPIASPPPPVTSNAQQFLINPPLSSTGNIFPVASEGVAYSQPLMFAGGTGPIASSLLSGTLPNGINLSPTAGPLAGTPILPGDFLFTLHLVDAWSNTLDTADALQVVGPAGITVGLSPSSVPVGTPGVQVAIGGNNFLVPTATLPGSVAEWLAPGASPVLLTTVVSSTTQATATVPASLLLAPVSAAIAIVQPNGTTSNSAPFAVVPPTITSLTPSSVTAGTAAFTLSVNGTNFVNGSQVSMGGVPLATAFGSSTNLTAAVTAALVSAAGSFNVIVTNPGGVTSPAALFTVTSKVTILTTSLPPVQTSVLYDFFLSATGGTLPYTWTVTGLAGTVTLTPSTGEMRGQWPTAGSFPVGVSVVDAAGQTASALFTQTVSSSPVPLAIPHTGTPPPGVTGVPYIAMFPADGGTPPYTYTLTPNPPPGLTFSNGTLSGTPTTPGTFDFTIGVTDFVHSSVSGGFQVTVSPAPLQLTGSVGNAVVGSTLNVSFGATGGIPPYTFSTTGTLPTGTTFNGGNLSGPLTATGSFTFSVTVTDSVNATASKTFTVNVTAAPLNITTASLPNGTVGVVYTATLAAQGGVPPYGWSATGLPTGLSLSSGGAITGSPTATGNFTVAATVTDSNGAKASHSFPVTIVPFTPSINLQSLPDGVVGVAYSANLTATGGVQPYTWAVTGLPGGLSASTGGAVTGTPTASGNFTLQVSLTDSNGTHASGNVSLTIAPATGPLTITTTSLPGGPVNTSYSATLTASGGAPPYNWSATGLPNGLSVSSGGAITGSPTVSGTFTVVATVIDTQSTQVSKSLSLTIGSGSLVITTTSLPNGVVGAAYSATLAASGGSPPYNWAATGLPGGLSVSSGGAITGTPTTAGSFTVRVTVTDTSEGDFATQTFTLAVVVAPSITSLSPNFAVAGGAGFILIVNGANFVSGAQVVFGGSPLTTTFVNSASLTAAVPASSVSKVGVINVTVVNPGNVGSNPATFTAYSKVTILTATLPAGQTGTYYTTTLVATGGLPPYTWSIAGLPGTLTLNPTTGVISGTWTFTGNFNLNVTVTDSVGQFATAQYSTSVNIPPVPLQIVTPTPLPQGTVGVGYGATIFANGGTSPYTFALSASTAPPGLKFTSDGALSGTPTTAGVFSFTIGVTDSVNGVAYKTFQLTVAPAPLSVSGTVSDTTVGATVSDKFSANGGVPPYTFSESGTLPPGTTFSNTGTLSGAATATGTFTFTVTASDSAQSTASKPFTIKVTVPALTIVTASLPAGQVGVAYGAQASATGGVPPYTWVASGLPAGVSASTAGAFTGTPTTAATYSVSVTVTDSAGSKASQTYTVAILPASVTVTTTSLPAGIVGVSYSAGLSATGGALPYSWTATGLPDGLALAAAGAISGTPTLMGTFTVGFTVTDAKGATGSASLSLTIMAAPLVISTTTLSGTVGTAVSGSLAATGGVPPYTWSATGLPAGIAVSTGGALSGTPTAAGTSTASVTVTDSAGTMTSGSVTVTIGLPPPPALTFTGLPTSTGSASQSTFQVGLGAVYPVAVTVSLTLTFAPTSGADDPAVQFSTGGRTATITVPAGQTAGATSVGIQTGTVAGSITITAHLTASGEDVTPIPAPSRAIQIPASAPVVTSMTAAVSSGGFTVTIVGYSNTRDVSQAVFSFTAASGQSLQTSQLTVTLSTVFSQWYGSAAAAPYGGQFTLTQPFTVNGNQQAVSAVSVTLTNSVGTSAAMPANVP